MFLSFFGIGAAIGASYASGDAPTETVIYRMTYTDISQTTAGFHIRALSSPDPNLAGEGCVRTISDAEALKFVNALKIGQPSQNNSLNVEDAGIMSVSDSSGRFAGPLSLKRARDFEGNIYETSRAESVEIERVGLQILLDNGCEDARYRLEIQPYR